MDNKTLFKQESKKPISLRDGVKKMLSLVGKAGCQESKQKIFRAIGFSDNETVLFDDEGHAMRIYLAKGKALANLERNYLTNRAKDNISHDYFIKRITAFRNSLKKSVKLMNDPEVVKIFKHHAKENAKDQKMLQLYNLSNNAGYDYMDNYSETYKRMSELYKEVDLAILANSHKRKNKGKIPLAPLHNYVYELAVLYKNLSKENLSVFRDEEPITPGHEFIYIAIQLLNREFLEDNSEPLEEKYVEIYTNKNIYNSCEKVRTLLNRSKQ